MPARPEYRAGLQPFADGQPFDPAENDRQGKINRHFDKLHRLADQIQAELSASYPINGCPRWLAEQRAAGRLRMAKNTELESA